MWLEDLVTVLEDADVGTYGVDIFVSTKAAIPRLVGSATLHIIETGGTAPQNTQNATIVPAYLQPGAQLTARADNYNDAREMADAAWQALVKVRNQFINSGWYRKIRALQQPHDLNVDHPGQAEVTFNVLGDYNRRA